jgi:DNA polymerase-3 subunit epsilon
VRPRHRWLFRVGPRHLHGIDRRSLRAAPEAATVLRELGRRMGGALLVAHNAEFDTAFLHAAARAAGIELQLSPAVCTLRLSRRLDPERQLSHRLGDICARYGVTLQRPHDALADADATAAVLVPLLQAHGITSPDQLAAAS